MATKVIHRVDNTKQEQPKISQIIDSIESKEQDIPVNLLHSPQTHRNGFYEKYDSEQGHRVYYTQKTDYVNGESVICSGSYLPKGNMSNIAARKVGEQIEQRGLTRKQAAKIRRTVRILHHISPNNKLTLLTLTYGAHYPSDKQSKRQLDSFFKRIKRQFYKGKDFHYLWVAEKQERGAIHYHIVFIDYIPIADLKKHWNGIVQKWQHNNEFQMQPVHPNVQGFETVSDSKHISRYLSKAFHRIGGYLTKKGKEHTIQAIQGNIWNSATITKKLCKGDKYTHIAESKSDAINVYNDLAYEVETDNNLVGFEHEIEGTNVRILIVQPKEQDEIQAPEQAPKQAPEPIQYNYNLTQAYPQDVSTIQDNLVNDLWI